MFVPEQELRETRDKIRQAQDQGEEEKRRVHQRMREEMENAANSWDLERAQLKKELLELRSNLEITREQERQADRRARELQVCVCVFSFTYIHVYVCTYIQQKTHDPRTYNFGITNHTYPCSHGYSSGKNLK